ncbi:MAG: VIT1/CCC1 transporter family protein [Frankia sp.]
MSDTAAYQIIETPSGPITVSGRPMGAPGWDADRAAAEPPDWVKLMYPNGGQPNGGYPNGQVPGRVPAERLARAPRSGLAGWLAPTEAAAAPPGFGPVADWRPSGPAAYPDWRQSGPFASVDQYVPTENRPQAPPNGARRRAASSAPRREVSADRYREYLASERQSAALYRGLADVSDREQGAVLRELAGVEDEHAAYWADKLRTLGESLPSDRRRKRGVRLRILIWLARSFSLSAVLPALERGERGSAGRYDEEVAAAPRMRLDERKHARMLANMSMRQVSRGGIGAGERWHHTDRSGALRAAVFGVNDGLVSNTSLVLGFVGSGAAGGAILLAGVAGLLAGAFSMGAGEFVSVSSQRESFESEIRLEEQELRDFPEGEERELALLYQAKGLSREKAEETARSIIQNPKTALDTLAREELGLDPDELGSPWVTAASSASSFTAGAFVVVLPFLIGSGTMAAVVAVALAGIALAAVGGSLSLLSGNSPLRGAFRQIVVGGLAAAAAFGIGVLLGVNTN